MDTFEGNEPCIIVIPFLILQTKKYPRLQYDMQRQQKGDLERSA